MSQTTLKMVQKPFADLTVLELYHILQARQDIFIIEQTCIYPDIDNLDQIATHVFLKDGDDICAYARIYWDDHHENTVKIGRVIAPRRGTGAGLQVMLEAVRITKEEYKPEEILLHAQEYARGFYEKAGFHAVSEETFLEDDIPHLLMKIDGLTYE